MARLQILELPKGNGDDRPPFVLIVDECIPQRIALGAEASPATNSPSTSLASTRTSKPMADATVKVSDGVREVTVELHGSDDDPLARAEETATRLFGLAVTSAPAQSRTGFGGWALSSDTERGPEE